MLDGTDRSPGVRESHGGGVTDLQAGRAPKGWSACFFQLMLVEGLGRAAVGLRVGFEVAVELFDHQ